MHWDSELGDFVGHWRIHRTSKQRYISKVCNVLQLGHLCPPVKDVAHAHDAPAKTIFSLGLSLDLRPLTLCDSLLLLV